MAKVGYVRETKQSPTRAYQMKQLQKEQVVKTFVEKSDKSLPQLQALLAYIREGDQVIVDSLSCLGHSAAALSQNISAIRRQGASLNVLNLPSFANVKDPQLRAIITDIIAELYEHHAKEFEAVHKRNQQRGIEIAKQKGKYKGKAREYGPHSTNKQKRDIYQAACRLLDQKEAGMLNLTKRDIARRLKIAPVTLYRIEKYRVEDRQTTS